MPLNFVHPNIRVTIGDIDWTDWLTILRVSETRFDPKSPYLKSGEFEIVPTTQPFPVNPSHRENEAYWRPYAQPVRVYLEGELIATLRIQKYLWVNEGDRWKGSGQLADLLAKADRPSPTSDYDQLVGASWIEPCTAALLKAGLPTPVNLPTDTVGLNHAIPPIKRDESPITWVAEMAGLRGNALYLTPDESPAFVEYRQKSPAFRLPREGVDRFDYQDDAEVYDKIVVSGSRQTAKKGEGAKNWDYDFFDTQEGWIPTVAIADGKYTEGGGPPVWGTISTVRKWKRGYDAEGSTTTAAAGTLWTNSPVYSGSATQIVTEQKELLNYYDGRGRLYRRVENTYAAQGAAHPAELEGRSNTLLMSQTVEDWTFDTKNYVSAYGKVSSSRYLISTPKTNSTPAAGTTEITHTDLKDYFHTLSELTVQSAVTEYWYPSRTQISTKPSNQPWIHHTIEQGRGAPPPMDSEKGRIKLGPLLPIRTDTEQVDGPPSPESKPPDREIVDTPFRVEVLAQDAIEPHRILEVSDDRLRTNAEARAYGQFLLALYWGRYYGRFVTLPARRRYWQDAPLQTCHIQTQSLIVEGRALVWAEGEPAEIAFFGNHLGTIPAVPYQPLAIRADFSGPDLSFLKGAAIEPIQIVLPPVASPSPSQPPYTVTSTTNLPTGLTVEPVNLNASEPSQPPVWTVQLTGTPTTLSSSGQTGTGGTATPTVTLTPTSGGSPIVVTLPMVVEPPPVVVPPLPLSAPALDQGEVYWQAIAYGDVEPSWVDALIATDGAETVDEATWLIPVSNA